MQHDFYRQFSFHRMSAGLDAQGTLMAWKHRIVTTPIRSVFDSPERRHPKHVAAQEIACADTLPYAVPNFLVDYAPVLSAVPRAWWRGVESSFNAFATECFIEVVAHAAGQDPCEFRIRLLEIPPVAATKPEATAGAPRAEAAAHQIPGQDGCEQSQVPSCAAPGGGEIGVGQADADRPGPRNCLLLVRRQLCGNGRRGFRGKRAER